MNERSQARTLQQVTISDVPMRLPVLLCAGLLSKILQLLSSMSDTTTPTHLNDISHGSCIRLLHQREAVPFHKSPERICYLLDLWFPPVGIMLTEHESSSITHPERLFVLLALSPVRLLTSYNRWDLTIQIHV